MLAALAIFLDDKHGDIAMLVWSVTDKQRCLLRWCDGFQLSMALARMFQGGARLTVNGMGSSSQALNQ